MIKVDKIIIHNEREIWGITTVKDLQKQFDFLKGDDEDNNKK